MSRWQFAVTSVRVERYAAVPTLLFGLQIAETTGLDVQAVALRIQIRIEPGRRPYAPSEAARLYELFGQRSQWPDTVKPLLWTNTSVTVPAFRGQIELEVPVTCTYDLEVASTKYFHALDAGEIALLFLFSGTVFVKTAAGFSVEQVPWELEAAWRLPAAVWREAMDRYFPNSAWLRLSRESVDRLQQYKQRNAHPTWESAIDALLRETEQAKLP